MTPEEERIALIMKALGSDTKPYGKIVNKLNSKDIADCRADPKCIDINEGDKEGVYKDPKEYEKNIRDQPGEEGEGNGEQQQFYEELFKNGKEKDERNAAGDSSEESQSSSSVPSMNSTTSSTEDPSARRVTLLISAAKSLMDDDSKRKGRLFGSPMPGLPSASNYKSVAYKPPKNGPF